MQYPNITQYKYAIQDPDSYATLNDDIETVISMEGIEPIFASGNFAVVFKMIYKNKLHALKCFLKDIPERAERQKQIVQYIKSNLSDYFVDYHYLQNELWVDIHGGAEYPVSWMHWLEAPTLGVKINEYCKAEDKDGLNQLAEKFKEFALWLLQQDFAHGDLKHDNLLVKAEGTLVMVDYDGMFIPAFAGKMTNELGGKSYQHPKRTATTFDRHLDDFSILIIYISLLALSKQPSLYNEFYNGQNILFAFTDFADIKQSTLISELQKIDGLQHLIDVLKNSLKSSSITIENIKDLIEGSISISDYSNELKKTEQIVQAGYRSLLDYINLNMDKAHFKNIIRSQQEILTRQFTSLENNLQKIKIDKNPLTKEWWVNLNEEWKQLFLFNVDFVPKIDNINMYWALKSIPYGAYFESALRFKQKKYSILEILGHIWKLKMFCVEPNMKDLSPIADLKNLMRLDLYRNTEDLSPIANLKNLTILFLDNNEADISPIASLKNLIRLELYNYNETKVDLSLIANLKNLTELSLRGNRADLSPIVNLKNLTKLRLDDPKADISPIANLTNLTELSLNGSQADLSPIVNLKNLTKLRLDDPKADISPIANLKNLIKLQLNNSNYTKADLSTVANLKNLVELRLTRNTANLNPIANLKKLKWLSLSLDKADLSPIASLTNLTKLNLEGNETDLSTVANLKNLVELRLIRNTANLSPIANLTSLTKLDLEHNKLDLSPIANLINLTELKLYDNKADLSPIANLTNLTNLNLYANNAGISPIRELIAHIKANGGTVLGVTI